MPSPFVSKCDLQIPHKSASEFIPNQIGSEFDLANRIAQNFTDIERWARRFRKECLPSAGGHIPSLFVASVDASDADKAVADYVCDGTNDHVDINAAIADCAASDAGTGRVLLSAGTFYIAGNITLDSIHLAGMGRGSTWLATVGTQVPFITVSWYATISDLQIFPQGVPSSGAGSTVLDIMNGHYATVRDVSIVGGYTYLVDMTTTFGSPFGTTITGCEFNGNLPTGMGTVRLKTALGDYMRSRLTNCLFEDAPFVCEWKDCVISANTLVGNSPITLGGLRNLFMGNRTTGTVTVTGTDNAVVANYFNEADYTDSGTDTMLGENYSASGAWGGGGGGGGTVEVQDEGVTETAAASIMNFTGAGVTATDAGGGQVDIDIPGSTLDTDRLDALSGMRLP